MGRGLSNDSDWLDITTNQLAWHSYLASSMTNDAEIPLDGRIQERTRPIA